MLEIGKNIRMSAIRKKRCAGPKNIKYTMLIFESLEFKSSTPNLEQFSFAKASGF